MFRFPQLLLCQSVRITVLTLFCLWGVQRLCYNHAYAVDSVVPIKNLQGEQIGSYKESHALLVGVSEYKDNWLVDLPYVKKDLEVLKNSFMQESIHVISLLNPTGKKLKTSLKKFIDLYGVGEEDRLIIFFSGHGYTKKVKNKKINKGYILPADMQDPLLFPNDLVEKAISIKTILKWLEDIKSPHTLLLFDSLFSDETLKNKARTDKTEDISVKTLQNVLQFATAGTGYEDIKPQSLFVPSVVNGLSGGADFNDDQYVTGTELFIYLNEKLISSESGLTPRYGKIKGKGDFLFQVVSSGKLNIEPSQKKFKSFLEVSSNVDSQIFINGFDVGKTPLKEYSVVPGEYMVWAKNENFITYKHWLTVDYGKLYRLDVSLNHVKVPRSKLFIKTRPVNTSIQLLNFSRDFYQGIALEAGEYPVEVTSKGYETRTFSVEVNGKVNVNLEVSLDKLPDIPKVIENSIEMKFALVFPGNFIMGSPEDEKGREKDEIQHKVIFMNQFYMGITEVTQGQWKRIMGSNPSQFWKCGNECPVENVSWEDCQFFIERLNQLENTTTYRLPTEAEWEYCCRAETQTPIFTGKLTVTGWNVSPELNEVGWYVGNNCAEFATRWPDAKYECISRGTHPVAQKKANEWGFFDMHGNVFEWCQDVYNANAYEKHSERDPVYVDDGPGRVVRGGSWVNYPWLSRSANRDYFVENNKANYIGFRVVKEP